MFICDQDKDETETVKQTQTSEMYDGDGPKNVRSDVSEQEEDEESEECPVSISKWKGSYQVYMRVLYRSLIHTVGGSVMITEVGVSHSGFFGVALPNYFPFLCHSVLVLTVWKVSDTSCKGLVRCRNAICGS